MSFNLEEYKEDRKLQKEINDFVYEIGVRKAGYIDIYDAFRLIHYHAEACGLRGYDLPIEDELIMYYEDLKNFKMKLCASCKKVLHRNKFTKNVKAKDNKDYSCSDCKKKKREQKNGK